MNKLMRWWTAFVINSLTSEKFLKTDILLKKTSDISDNYPSIVWTHWIPFRVICWMEGRYSLGRPPVCCRAITPQSESSSNWESSIYLYFWTPTQRTARVWTWAFSLPGTDLNFCEPFQTLSWLQNRKHTGRVQWFCWRRSYSSRHGELLYCPAGTVPAAAPPHNRKKNTSQIMTLPSQVDWLCHSRQLQT